MEEWKDIPGYEGVYEVSSEGRVRSLDRMVEQTGNKGSTFMRRWPGKILHPLNVRGYAHINLYKINVRQYSIHRLVAQAFLEPLEGKDTVDHINRNRLDNRACNLRWADASDQALNKEYPLGVLGHRYISLTKDNTYQVHIQRQTLTICRKFFTLPEAIEARNNLLNKNNM